MKAKINYNASGTWLEPYIGHIVEVVKVGVAVIWFKWESGRGTVTKKYEKDCFNLIKTAKNPDTCCKND